MLVQTCFRKECTSKNLLPVSSGTFTIEQYIMRFVLFCVCFWSLANGGGLKLLTLICLWRLLLLQIWSAFCFHNHLLDFGSLLCLIWLTLVQSNNFSRKCGNFCSLIWLLGNSNNHCFCISCPCIKLNFHISNI